MSRYLSEAVMFKARQLATVLAKSEKIEFDNFRRAALMRDKAPMASITPPNTIAHKISQIVGNIPAIPLAENKSFNVSLSVGIVEDTVIAFMIPKYDDLKS